MLKKIYVVRHCEAKVQPSESPLTEKGWKQAGNWLALLMYLPQLPYKGIRKF
jgi:broad specificity phosphatase PhoE